MDDSFRHHGALNVYDSIYPHGALKTNDYSSFYMVHSVQMARSSRMVLSL